MSKETIQEFSDRMDILSRVLKTDYFISEVGVIDFPMRDTDWGCYNVMTFDGSNGEVKWDEETEEYYMTQDIMRLLSTGEYDDVIDYNIESEDDVLTRYLKEDDYTVVWIHPVKRGSLSLFTHEMYVGGCENSSYNTPSSFVIVGNKSYPLETR